MSPKIVTLQAAPEHEVSDGGPRMLSIRTWVAGKMCLTSNRHGLPAAASAPSSTEALMTASGDEDSDELSVLIDAFGRPPAPSSCIGRSEPLSTVTEFQVSCMEKMPNVPLIVLETSSLWFARNSAVGFWS